MYLVVMYQRNDDSYDETAEYLTEYSPELAFQDSTLDNDSINAQLQSNSDGSFTLHDNVADTFSTGADHLDDFEQDDPQTELNVETADKKKFYFLLIFM